MEIRSLKFVLLTILSMAALPSRTSGATKTDVLIMDNGDHITGEVVTVSRGMLTFKTDNLGTLSVKWRHVAELRSKNSFTIETGDGTIYFGSLAPASDRQLRVVDDEESAVTLDLDTVVYVGRVKDSLWKRLDGSVDVGYSFTQSNGATQLNVDATVGERTEKRRVNITYSSSFNTQNDAAETTRNSLEGQYDRLFEGRWFAIGFAKAQQNSGLDLDLRTLFAGSVGRELYHSNLNLFAVTAGLGYNRERYAGEDDTFNSLEFIGGLEFSHFSFDDHKTQFTNKLAVVPSLTESGRVRLQLDTQFRRKVVGNLYWNIKFYETYDSRPPQKDANKNDFGITTSFGWTF
jgi:hypothetical protein